MSYSLRTLFKAHSNNVTTLATMDSCIISGSRDRTVKQWTETGNEYEETTVLPSRLKYIYAVCAVSPFGSHEVGLIFCGGHDNKIVGFTPYTSELIITLTGHSGPVCCLSPSAKPGYLLSSSWDNTAKLWDISSGQCLTTFYGHSQNVWCVISMPGSFVVTGSADKLIKVFTDNGACAKTLKGHTLSVRGLTYFEQDVFLSCSNDGTIRKWNLSTGLNEILTHHDTIIFSVTAMNNLIAFGGKNTFVIWTSDNNEQPIELSETNICTVVILPNTDVVTGSSDGFIRIYTNDKLRLPSKEKLTEYEEELGKENITSEIKVFDLPGKEALTTKGLFDGEIKLIHANGNNYCYSWSEDKKSWNILDESLSQFKSTKNKQKKNKQIFNDKEYDYIFVIELNGHLPLQLPYNKGDDPTFVAQQFIIDNSLNPDHLDYVVEFLMESTGQGLSNKPSTSQSKPEGFVFESRSYYPPKKPVTFEQFDLKSICKKLDDSMWQMNFTEEKKNKVLKDLKNLATNNVKDDANIVIDVLITAIAQWPKALVYTVLDITRIVALNSAIHRLLFADKNARRLLSSLDRFMETKASVNNKMFLFRIFSNMFSGQEGEKFIFKHRKTLLPQLQKLVTEDHKGLQIAVTTFIMNMSLTVLTRRSFQASKLCLRFLENLCGVITDPEATFRMLVALGTIGIIDGAEIMTDNILKFVESVAKWKDDDPISSKSSMCADCILKDVVPQEALDDDPLEVGNVQASK